LTSLAVAFGEREFGVLVHSVAAFDGLDAKGNVERVPTAADADELPPSRRPRARGVVGAFPR